MCVRLCLCLEVEVEVVEEQEVMVGCEEECVEL